jgi:hypothetical protein
MHRSTGWIAAIIACAGCGQDARPPAPVTGPPAAAPDVRAPAPPIALAASAERGILTLTLTNAGPAPIEIATRVEAGARPQYDGLTVRLDDGRAPRALRFVDDRDRAAVVTTPLAPGAAVTESIDLIAWAVRAGNGAPLAAGTYRVEVAWDATQATRGVRVAATTTTTPTTTAPAAAACARAGYRAPAGARLIVLGAQAPTGRATVYAGLYNAGTEPVCVDSHVATHEWQSDWLTVMYADGAKYHHASRVIALDDARDKSYPVSATLEPGQVIWHTVDVDAWARRPRNGAEPLPAGSLYTQVGYDTTGATDVWAGRLVSESFGLTVK